MDDSRLTRLRDELAKARKKRDDWEAKVKDLERKYNEAEKVCVYGIFQAANLTPEQLAELIRTKGTIPQVPGAFCGDQRQPVRWPAAVRRSQQQNAKHYSTVLLT